LTTLFNKVLINYAQRKNQTKRHDTYCETAPSHQLNGILWVWNSTKPSVEWYSVSETAPSHQLNGILWVLNSTKPSVEWYSVSVKQHQAISWMVFCECETAPSHQLNGILWVWNSTKPSVEWYSVPTWVWNSTKPSVEWYSVPTWCCLTLTEYHSTDGLVLFHTHVGTVINVKSWKKIRLKNNCSYCHVYHSHVNPYYCSRNKLRNIVNKMFCSI
jgi:ribosomal protein S14